VSAARPRPHRPGPAGSRPRRRGALAALLAAGGLALAGCGGAAGATAPAAVASGHDHGGSSAPAAVTGPEDRYAGIDLRDPYARPQFTLTDTDGAPWDFTTRTKGRPTLLFFGYTHCPDICPTTMADIAVALRGLEPAVARQVQVVFVTTDPARDTPQVLGSYLRQFDADLPVRFTGLTGSQQDLDAAQLSAGVPVAEDGGQTHSALLLLYGADDRAHVAFDAGNTPADIQHDLGTVAAGS
jgi:protein SCO1/2